MRVDPRVKLIYLSALPGIALAGALMAFARALPPTPRVYLLVFAFATLTAYALLLPYLLGAFHRYETASWGQLAVWLRSLMEGEKMRLPDVPVKLRPVLNVLQQTLASQSERLGTLAIIDPKSGALSRAGLLRRLRDEIERARRFERSLSVVTISHGPGLDDGQAFFSTVRRYARTVDLVAKTSEDTVALLLPETSREGAHELARRIRADLEAGQSVAFGVGIAVLPEDGQVAEQLLTRAEREGQSGLHSGPSVENPSA